MIRRGLLPGLAALAVAAALVLPSRAPRVHSATLYVFGTLVEVVIEGVPEARAAAATAELGQLFQTIHRDWHAWAPGGELSSINAAIAQGVPAPVTPGLAALLREGQALSAASGGLFDPGIGAEVALWGFHDDLPPEGPPPAEARIARLRAAHPSIADLTITDRVTSSNPMVSLDLGAFAKGAALDLGRERLRALGIENAVLNAGGGVEVMGTRHGRPWRVAIRNPFDWGAVAAVELRPGEVVHTSGNYERFLEAGGVRLSHILDPRTARPVTGIVSATVLDTSGTRADAASTALSVAGPEHWRSVAAAMGVTHALVIDDTGAIAMTDAMRDRVTLTDPAGRPVDLAMAR